MTSRNISLIIALSIAFLCPAVFAEDITTPGRIESVTVYRGQALVSRIVSLGDKTGELMIIVPDLPEHIIGASLHAGSGDGVAIRSVRYRTRAVEQAPQKEVAELEAQIKDVNSLLYTNSEMLNLLASKSSYIDKLENFSTTTSHADLEKGALNAESLAKITDQVFAMREKLTKEKIALTQEGNDLREKLALLQRQLGELTKGGTKTVREAVLFVRKPAGDAADIRLNYLVDSAGWSPTYNFRLNGDGDKVAVEYLARVYQMTGEDWNGVKLSLSTASPQMNARTPLLSPMWIDLTAAAGGKQTDGGFFAAPPVSQTDQASVGKKGWAATSSLTSSGNIIMNRDAANNQYAELNVKGEEFSRFRQAVSMGVQEVLAVTYDLPGPMSLASRNDQQLVQIAVMEMPGKVYHSATPLLTPYVYRTARISNDSSVPLLAGPYNSYIGGEFVGQGELRLVARGEEAHVGFGVDTQLRCSRELTDKSDAISWGSRIQKFNYRLRLENYKDTPVSVMLLDRIPATKTDQIQITLGKLSHKLSTDEVYVRDEKDKGLLRWDITLPAKAAGAKAVDVTYDFEMKFAKDMHVGREAAPSFGEMEEDAVKRFERW